MKKIGDIKVFLLVFFLMMVVSLEGYGNNGM
jgi:hypothetical protein